MAILNLDNDWKWKMENNENLWYQKLFWPSHLLLTFHLCSSSINFFMRNVNWYYGTELISVLRGGWHFRFFWFDLTWNDPWENPFNNCRSTEWILPKFCIVLGVGFILKLPQETCQIDEGGGCGFFSLIFCLCCGNLTLFNICQFLVYILIIWPSNSIS